MSITFACSRCGKTYQVESELAGKKIRCKACGEVVRIPGPAPEAPPPGRRPGPTTPPPARRPAPKPAPAEDLVPSWLDEDDEDDDAPALPRATVPVSRRAEGRAGARAARSSGTGAGLDPATLKIAGIAGAVVLGLVVVIGIGVLAFGSLNRGAVAAHQEVITQGLDRLDELSALLVRIQDQDSARSVAAEVQVVVQTLVEIRDKAGQLPALTPAEEARLSAANGASTAATRGRWKRAIGRIKAMPGVPEALRGAIGRITTPAT